jgi:WD40 repeat protein
MMNPKMRKVVVKKRKQSGVESVSLQRIIGITSRNTSSLAVQPGTGNVVYTAAGVLVFYDATTNAQVAHYFNPNNRAFSCLSFSADGRYLATGESTCRAPVITVWECRGSVLLPVKSLKGHKYGVEHLSFSPTAHVLVSVGGEHDKGMFVWDWKAEVRLTSNKIVKKINCISFAPTADYFVTVGLKSIKFWHFDPSGKPQVTTGSEGADFKAMASRSVFLAEMKEKNFVSVVVGRGMVFTLTSEGQLCIFTPERTMDRWMDLHVTSAFSLSLSDRVLACGCADGINRLFYADSLEYITTLPRPPPLGEANISPDQRVIDVDPNSTFADAVGVVLFSENQRLLTLYSDRSVFVWDIKQFGTITALRAFLHHSGPINDLKILPTSSPDLTQFVTGSADKTIRFWHMFHTDPRNLEGQILRNAYSRDLSRIIYLGSGLGHFKVQSTEGSDEGAVKCISISPDGKFVASGDITGMLRVHSVATLQQVFSEQAHDSDILCMDYSGLNPSDEAGDYQSFLVTGSRDRLIHLFNVDRGYSLVSTIDDHSSTVSDVKFVRVTGQERLVSCGHEKNLVFRTVKPTGTLRYAQRTLKPNKCYSLAIHPLENQIVTGEDKAVKVWDIEQAKVLRNYDEIIERSARSQADSNTKVILDASGLLVAAANADRVVRLIDFNSGRVISKMSVGEVSTSMAFSPNGKKLLTTTSDGCIFIWKLSEELTQAIQKRLSRKTGPPQKSLPQNAAEELLNMLKDQVAPAKPHKPLMKDSVMPNWAKSIAPEEEAKAAKSESPFAFREEAAPGKWGQARPVSLDIEPQSVQSHQDEDDVVILSDRNLIKLGIKDVDSDEEEEIVTKPVAAMPRQVHRFELTASMNKFSGIEEEKDDQTYEAEPDISDIIESDDEEAEKERHCDPMRMSLSRSFMQRKEVERTEPKESPFFQVEQVKVDPEHMPRIIELGRPKDEERRRHKLNYGDYQGDIQSAVKAVEQISHPTEKPRAWPKRQDLDDKQRAPPKPEPQQSVPVKPVLQDEPLETPPKVPEEAKRPEAKKAEVVSDRFASPATVIESQLDTTTTSIPDLSSSISVSSFTQKGSRQHYTQCFQSLRHSLQEVCQFFSRVEPDDLEYSVSMEESAEEVDDIKALLSTLSSKLGGSLQASIPSKDEDLLEKYSDRLLTLVEKKLMSRQGRDYS